MKLSIFTPTHRTDHLHRLKKSIDNQTYKNWEWVIVPNNGAQVDFNDDRIKIIPTNGENIGYLKYFSCIHCTGEVLVEVDHDDELTPDCLEEIRNAFTEKVDFVFSNWCSVDKNYTNINFSPFYGWEYRPFKYLNYNLNSTIAFQADPRSFSKIWYCPNHVRCWRRTFYNTIGGHDSNLDILDDHDLLCRTYIRAREIKHIDKCLYIYHIHDNNTSIGEKNTKIQTMTLEIHDKYIEAMVERWAKRKINLYDLNKYDRYENIKINEILPLENESVDLFRVHDVLPLVGKNIIKEIYRCLRPNGWMLSMTPSTDGRGAFQDPRYISYWNSNSFWYYTSDYHASHIENPVKFQLNRINNFYPTIWHKENNIVYTKADLVKFSGRTPGLVN